MTKTQTQKFYFKKQDTVGATDAKDDGKFLYTCFVDTGDLGLIEDITDPRCLVLGRTGAGKTALLTKLDEIKQQKVIHVNPEAMAMQHISNSTIINYISDLDIELNTFFKLLWRHALCVEIFVKHFKITNEYDYERLLEDIRYRLKKLSPRHLRAFEYLEKWGDTFWKEDESHVTQMIAKTEDKLKGEFGGSFKALKATIGKTKNLSTEQRVAYQKRAQSFVDETQMKEVAALIDMLDEVLEFQQMQYYLVIDKLDEGWVENKLRYRLIKALIETVRDLNRCKNIKPLVVLRADLLGHVFEITHDAGFQEEKYQSLYLNVRWTKTQLIELIDKRINELLQSRYSKRTPLTHSDILPKTINGVPSIDYILNRTLMRPRDVIEFFNSCIGHATDTAQITEEMVMEAEYNYSRARLDSVYYEWIAEYPALKEWVKYLRRKNTSFFVGSVSPQEIKNDCDDYVLLHSLDKRDGLINDRLYQLANQVAELKLSPERFRNHLVHIFYTVGLLGLQVGSSSTPTWCYDVNRKIMVDDIDPQMMVTIHPCFQSALNTQISEIS
jgi:hypothetical protein